MILTEAPTIFRGAPIDYNIRVMKCKHDSVNLFVKHIVQIIKEETGYDPQSRVKYRGRKFVESRQIMASILSDYTNHTQEIIGKEIGDKNHATIVHCKKTIDDLCDTDINFRAVYAQIEKRVKLLVR